MKKLVTTYYLEMTAPAMLRPKRADHPTMDIERAEVPCPELNRFLYTAVGGDWYWTDRLVWTYQQWQDYLDRPELETWIGYVSGTPAGYFELERQSAGNVEIAYFGLLPQFTGRGFGATLLTAAIECAWQPDTRRVWVHTCTLDGSAALSNYLARGFQQYKMEEQEEDLPEITPGPWPGAYGS